MSDNTNLVRIGGWSGIAMIVIFAVAILLLPGTAAGGWLAIKERAALDSHCRVNHHRDGLRMVDTVADPGRARYLTTTAQLSYPGDLVSGYRNCDGSLSRR